MTETPTSAYGTCGDGFDSYTRVSAFVACYPEDTPDYVRVNGEDLTLGDLRGLLRSIDGAHRLLFGVSPRSDSAAPDGPQ
jgi:hypothetical protein